MKRSTVLYITFLVGCLPLSVSSQAFTDWSAAVGFNATGKNIGVAVSDFDNDGFEDIYVSRRGLPNLLYRNTRSGSFAEEGELRGVAYSGESNTSIFLDYDNDGDLDLYVANYRQANILYRNDNGYFTDVTTEMGVGNSGRVSSVNAVDYDADGDLDIYVANFNERNLLYRNDKNKFTEVAAGSGLTKEHPSMGSVFFDFDNDGDADLYQVNDGNIPNELYENEGWGFRDVSYGSGLDYAGFGMGVDVGDMNNDGWLDLYVTNLYDNILFQNKGNGHFQDLSAISKTNDRGMGWGTVIFDCNNDGRKDIYVANDTKFGVNGEKLPNRLYENLGSFIFYPHPDGMAINSSYSSYGTAFLDLDNDGNLDIVIANNGSEGNQLLKNENEKSAFISFRLVGHTSNSSGVGARLELFCGDKKLNDMVTCGSGYASQSSSRIHFGLENLSKPDSVIIWWPGGQKQVVTVLQTGVLNTIEEDAGIQTPGLVVWTDPPFPNQLDDVTVYFDASEGNGTLAGYDALVFTHTGVITSNSSSETDWQHVIGNWGTFDSRVIMEHEGDDIYSISYNINDFYGINPGEEVYQMAFVFRNQDGSLVGRDADGSDIFTDVYPPDEALLATVLAPVDEQTVIFEEDSLLVQLQINKRAKVEILDNDILIYSDSTDFAEIYIKGAATGTHLLRFKVSLASDSLELTRGYLVLNDSGNRTDAPSGVRPGVNYYSDSSYIFSLYAPGKQYVFFLTAANGFAIDPAYLMNKSMDGNTFWIELPKGIFENGQNTYQFSVNGSTVVADPYSEVILDPANDAWIDPAVMNELPPYPEGLANGIVTVFDLEDQQYPWESNDFMPPEKKNLIVYELLIRDFLEDHSYASLIDSLDYLERLGVNAIELMPVNEFEGNISWGYNPSFHMAVDKYYGTRDDLKKFIDEAHKRGIAVILDVVFNHAFSQSPLASLYWDPASFKPTPDNPWLNPDARHPFNVGYDFNHESEATKQWVKRNLEHWIDEYRFDGFRFDLSKGFTQRNSGNDVGFWGTYDAFRISILKEYADHIWSLDSDNYVILEHFAENSEEQELAAYGMMLWGNVTFQYAEAAMGYDSELEFADYRSRGFNEPHLVAYMESHDEERMMYKLGEFGDRNSDYDTREQETALKRVEAASAIFYSVPGPRMLWQFGELGYDYSINYCPNGSINEGCRVDPKPIRWDYLNNENRVRLYNMLSNLFHLKTNYPTFSTDDYIFNDGNFYLKTVHLYHPEMDAVSMANFRIVNSDLNPKFPYPATWFEYFSGDSLVVTDTQEKLTFGPGEYRIYTSEKITPPNGFITSTKELITGNIKNIYPNPANPEDVIFIPVENPNEIRSLSLSAINGRIYHPDFEIGNHKIRCLIPDDLPAGSYVISLRYKDNSLRIGNLIVMK